MTASTGKSKTDAEIARLAYSIWEAEGRPEGRDHEHWLRAKELVERSGAGVKPEVVAGARDEIGQGAARPVQPGFEDVLPRVVPEMKEDAGTDLREGPGGRFAQQIAHLPEEGPEGRPTTLDTPGPRNPTPIPPTNDEGYVSIPSVDDATGGALNDDPAPAGNDQQKSQFRQRDASEGTVCDRSRNLQTRPCDVWPNA